MKFLTVAAMVCALGAVASAATPDDINAIADATFTEPDEALTAEFNADAEAGESAEIVRRGGGGHHMPAPPAPPAGCCYWKGYSYKPGCWYGQCYCDNGKWTCYKPAPKPLPPPTNWCHYNGCNYKHGSTCYFDKGYNCQCDNGRWDKCEYQKPVYYSKGW